jgi:hypothetical protein
VYAAAGDGYAESTDGGLSWTHPETGLDHRYVWSVAADPGNPDVVLVSAARSARSAHGGRGTAESYLYRRTGQAEAGSEAEQAWERIGGGIPTGEGVLRAVLAAGTEPGELYALNDRGLHCSRDGGVSWNRIDVAWQSAYEDRTARGLAVA